MQKGSQLTAFDRVLLMTNEYGLILHPLLISIDVPVWFEIYSIESLLKTFL